MKRAKISSIPFLTLLTILLLNSSFIEKIKPAIVNYMHDSNRSCIGIKVDDKWLADPFDPKAQAVLSVGNSGKLTITDAPNNGLGPFTQVEFKIYIKKEKAFSPIAVPEYTDQRLLEADLKTVLNHCQPGDQIILEAIESKKYAPHFQKINVVGKC